MLNSKEIKTILTPIVLVTLLIVAGLSSALTYTLTSSGGTLGGGEDTIAIGHILPISGPLGQYSAGFSNGVQAAVNEANDLGGINGKQIQLIEEDSATDPATAAEAARKLIEVNGVKAIIGVYASSSTLAAAPIVEENEVIMISPASTSPLVSTAGEFIFRTAPSDDLQGRAMAQLALWGGAKTAAVIHINNQYGQGLNDVFTEEFENGGGNVITSVPYNLESTTFRAELQQIMSGNPGVILDVSYADDGQIIFREAAELGLDAWWIGGDGIADPAIFDAPGVAAAMAGMRGTMPASPDTSGTLHYTNVMSKYGLESGIYSREAYDAAKLAILALSAAGPDATGAEIRDALIQMSTTYVGASGDKAFDVNGDVGGQFTIWEVRQSEFVTIGSWDQVSGIKINE